MAYIFGMSMGNGSWSIYMTKTESGTGAYAGNYPYTVTINGSTVGSGSASYDFRTWAYDQTGSITLASGSYSVRSGSNSGSATYSGGYSNTTASASYYYTPPVTYYSHKISYNANGGENAPPDTDCGSTTTKNSFTGTITTTQPTRSGYIFVGWSGSSTGTAIYQPGSSYTFGTQNVTLYAVWKALIYVKAGSQWTTGTLFYKLNGEWKEGLARLKVDNSWK